MVISCMLLVRWLSPKKLAGEILEILLELNNLIVFIFLNYAN